MLKRGGLNARVMKPRVMVILGVWIAQVMEIACKVHHMDCAGNGIDM